MNYFCTYCDRGYAARLLCLYDSLTAQGEPFRLDVLCFDADTAAVVLAQKSPRLRAILLEDFMAADPAYAAVRGQRSTVEFFFTATAALVRYCFDRDHEVDQVTYLDSDLYFFGPPSLVFAVQGQASVGIVPHRFPPRLAGLSKCGTYNVAWVSFRRDQNGLACLDWWRERCLEWCHDYFDQGRFADQGYLDEFPRRFGGVVVLDHPGINAAPWNMDGARIVPEGGCLRINNQRLMFFHFQGIREIVPGWFESGLRNYQAELTQEMRDLIYLPYLKKLVEIQDRLLKQQGIVPRLGYQRLPTGNTWPERWQRVVARWVWPIYRRWRGQLLHCPSERIR